MPEPRDPVLRAFALSAEGLGESDVKSLIHGLADSGWRREEFRIVMARLSERQREEAIYAYRLPNVFIQSRIANLEPHYVTLFQEALKFVAFAIATRETAPSFSSAILGVWRRNLGPVPGVDTPID